MFISTPTLPFEKLQVFYCEEFEGDAGSAAARRNGKVVGSFERQLKIARRRELPLVLRHIEDLKGKSVLDLRSRSGALAMAMQERGATVVASDPMLPNVELCHRAGLKAYQIGVFEHSDLSEFQASSFDAVTGLTIHVLAHLPEPDAFLRRTFDLLKPGGLLILNEKNVFKPARKSKPGIFASGIGHFYHFTPKTLEGMIKAAGFERVEVFDHPQRASAYRHMIAVARKPDNGLPAVYPVFRQDMEHVRAERAKAERSARLRAPFNRVKRRVRQAVKSLSRKISGP
jgi:2-polyprenyl-3-methyl-5-hydroxy-6-metoxy-1,4-benzoquinol methylase